MMSLKDKILAADDRPYRDVTVDEWDAVVRVRGLSGADAVAFAEKIDADPDSRTVMAELLVMTLHDPDTDGRIFSADDTDALLSRSSTVLSALVGCARDLSGLGDIDDAKNG